MLAWRQQRRHRVEQCGLARAGAANEQEAALGDRHVGQATECAPVVHLQAAHAELAGARVLGRIGEQAARLQRRRASELVHGAGILERHSSSATGPARPRLRAARDRPATASAAFLGREQQFQHRRTLHSAVFAAAQARQQLVVSHLGHSGQRPAGEAGASRWRAVALVDRHRFHQLRFPPPPPRSPRASASARRCRSISSRADSMKVNGALRSRVGDSSSAVSAWRVKATPPSRSSTSSRNSSHSDAADIGLADATARAPTGPPWRCAFHALGRPAVGTARAARGIRQAAGVADRNDQRCRRRWRRPVLWPATGRARLRRGLQTSSSQFLPSEAHQRDARAPRASPSPPCPSTISTGRR